MESLRLNHVLGLDFLPPQIRRLVPILAAKMLMAMSLTMFQTSVSTLIPTLMATG